MTWQEKAYLPRFVAILSLWYNMVGHANVHEQFENHYNVGIQPIRSR